MATVRTNPIVNGLSGMLGNTIVFKTLRGKTIMANRPSPPQKQSEQQKTNRSKFRDASHWAHKVLLDPEKKLYYQKKAKKLKLPNAYTAAITDYMRKPVLEQLNTYNQSTTYCVSKKDFDLKAVEVRLHDTNGAVTETRVITKDRYGDWCFRLKDEERVLDSRVSVIDAAGREIVFRVE